MSTVKLPFGEVLVKRDRFVLIRRDSRTEYGMDWWDPRHVDTIVGVLDTGQEVELDALHRPSRPLGKVKDTPGYGLNQFEEPAAAELEVWEEDLRTHEHNMHMRWLGIIAALGMEP